MTPRAALRSMACRAFTMLRAKGWAPARIRDRFTVLAQGKSGNAALYRTIAERAAVET